MSRSQPKLKHMTKTVLRLSMCVACAIGALPHTANALLPFENTGNLYVSMWTADEIAVFDANGDALERFTAPGLDGPRGIAFHPATGEIWIAAEFTNSIFIFDHEHQFLRQLEHDDFNEPVGITFSSNTATDPANSQVFISNSNSNEIMVFDAAENLVDRFTGTALVDPNCSAFLEDGTLLVTNRLGGTHGGLGAISNFDRDNNFQFDFTTDGIVSLMAVARDTNMLPSGMDDTVWVSSGAGDNGIYEFDPAGNLLTTLLPENIGDGRAIMPQGIAFDDEGNFVVISYLNEVIKFDADGNFLMRFPTGPGTARSTAYQACQPQQDGGASCLALGDNVGAGVQSQPDVAGSPAAIATGSEMTSDGSDDSAVNMMTLSGSSGGGAALGVGWLVLLFSVFARASVMHLSDIRRALKRTH